MPQLYEDNARRIPPTKRTEIDRHIYNDFTGGWRPDKALSDLAPNELSNVWNVEYELDGNVRKRGGFEEFTDAVTDLDNGEFLFVLEALSDESGASAFEQFVFMFNESDGSIYYQTFGELAEDFFEGTGTDLVDSGHSLGDKNNGAEVSTFRQWAVSALTWEDNIYFTSLRFGGFSGGSGAGGAWETFDGMGDTSTSASKPIRYDVADGTFSRPAIHDLDGTTSGFPRARTAISHYDRIFAANVQKPNAYKHVSRIYWSDPGTAETFQSTSWIAVGADDGQEIVSLLPFGDQILVFKTNSVHALVGTDEDTFALYELHGKVGTEGTYACDTHKDIAYFFDSGTMNVWAYDGANFTTIGDPIAEYIRDQINYNSMFKVNLQAFKDQIWLSYPQGDVDADIDDENTETLVYDTKTKTWTRWNFGVVPRIATRRADYTQTTGSTRIEGDSNPYFVISAAAQDDHIMRGYMASLDPDADVVWTNNGTNYTFQFRTGWFSPDRGMERKRLRRLEFLTAENSDQIDIDLYRDFINSVWKEISFDPLADSVPDFLEYHLMDSSIDVVGFFNWLALDVQATHANEAQINQIGLRFSYRPSPRGDVGGSGYHN